MGKVSEGRWQGAWEHCPVSFGPLPAAGAGASCLPYENETLDQ